jgi:hypothetical protein
MEKFLHEKGIKDVQIVRKGERYDL